MLYKFTYLHSLHVDIMQHDIAPPINSCPVVLCQLSGGRFCCELDTMPSMARSSAPFARTSSTSQAMWPKTYISGLDSQLALGVQRISCSGWPDIWPFLKSGCGQNSNGYRISRPDSDWSFLTVSLLCCCTCICANCDCYCHTFYSYHTENQKNIAMQQIFRYQVPARF